MESIIEKIVHQISKHYVFYQDDMGYEIMNEIYDRVLTYGDKYLLEITNDVLSTYDKCLSVDFEQDTVDEDWLRYDIIDDNVVFVSIHTFPVISMTSSFSNLSLTVRQWICSTLVPFMYTIKGYEHIIFDVRGNNDSKDDTMVLLFLSFLLGGKEHITTRVYPSKEEKVYTLTHQELQLVCNSRIPKLITNKLYVIVGKDTYGGVELFVNTLKMFRNAQIIGSESTGGCVTGGRMFEVSKHLRIHIPLFYYIHPETKDVWSKQGIRPDIVLEEDNVIVPRKRVSHRYGSLSVTKPKNILLLIDVQEDFHDKGSLAVPGASKDAKRLLQFIEKSLKKDSGIQFDRIVVTLDSHHILHIAHPEFWLDSDGKHPVNFTIIESKDVKDGKWTPRSDIDIHPSLLDISKNIKLQTMFKSDGSVDLKKYCIYYTEQLEQNHNMKLCIWPPHCLIGSQGHNVVPSVRSVLDKWSIQTGNSIDFVMKGMNLLTEMYSALKAEVVLSDDTDLNVDLVHKLIPQENDHLYICGQALSHCVNKTTRDLLKNMEPEQKTRVTLLEDCCSSVRGFEDAGKEFVEFLKDEGVNVRKSTDLL